MAYIELKDVTYTYPLVKEPALKNITASFEKGKFYGIIGENAGGKTTLCKSRCLKRLRWEWKIWVFQNRR